MSTAQETAVSEVSTSRSSNIPTSAPESSFNTAEISSSFNSSSDKDDDKNNSFSESPAAESSSPLDVAATDKAQTSNKILITTSNDIDSVSVLQCPNCSSTAMSETTTHTIVDEKALDDASQSDMLKTELNDKSSVTEEFYTHSNSSGSTGTASGIVSNEKKKQSNNISDTNINKATTDAAVKQPDYETSPGYVSTYSGPSSVPSEEELVYNSSYIERNPSPKDMTNSAPSQVQNEETENNDTKSATHKRSLNATNSHISSTTDMTLKAMSTMTPGLTSLSQDSALSKLTEQEEEKHSTMLPSKEEPLSQSSVNHVAVPKEDTPGIKNDDLKTSIKSSTVSISYDDADADDSDDVVILFSDGLNSKTGSKIMVPESSSSGDLKFASPIPVSLDALREKSIHPSESFDRTAQTPNVKYTAALSTIPHKSSDLEVEYEKSASFVNSPTSLVTFDPDGMTHNFTQDPDSVTFSPKMVNEKPTNAYFSNLEHEEMHRNKPELLPDNFSTDFVTKVVGLDSKNIDGYPTSEREREILHAGHVLSPHDEPDDEVPTLIHSPKSTKPFEEMHSSGEAYIALENETSSPVNDGSGEMVNDSPHFILNQNKPTVVPLSVFTNNNLNKDLENNISNDITHTSNLKSQGLQDSHHELDFPVEYQPQQSEIRPVTAVSPIKNSGAVTDIPIPHNVQSKSSSNETESDSIPNETSILVIPPNPAPSIANKSLEKIIVSIPPELLPKDYVTPKTIPTDHVPLEILPKDYVPPEMLPKDYVPSEKPQDIVKPEMLPKDYLPPEMLPKDYVTSEKTPVKEPVKPEILPKDSVPPELLPKDFVPSHLLPKDYVTPQTLPKDYDELGNNTDTNINTTIAGVAVKTSVSVSLPLSKSPNSTADALDKKSSLNRNVTPISVPLNKGKIFVIIS